MIENFKFTTILALLIQNQDALSITELNINELEESLQNKIGKVFIYILSLFMN